MRYLSIKNFAKHQHYKDRRPPWIKLHTEVLDDYSFMCLQDASKAHLMLLWVLASKMENKIPYDLGFINSKLGTTSPVDIEELILQGFISVGQDDSVLLAARKQNAGSETETETETETTNNKQLTTLSNLRPKRFQKQPPLTPDEIQVRDHYLARHPKRRVNDALAVRLIRPALKTYSPEELCRAIDGNADDQWHAERAKHELEYVLRPTKIESFIELGTPRLLTEADVIARSAR
jgi:hypothetical protein